MNLSAASSRQPNPIRRHTLYIKDPASAISHFIGAIGFAGAGIPLLIKAGQSGQPLALVAMTIYALSLVALYSASAAYHTIPASHPQETLLKKIDHMMIFVMIAGSYTPVCLLALPRLSGLILLGVIWGCTILGACSMLFFVCCISPWAGPASLRCPSCWPACPRSASAGCWPAACSTPQAV